VAPALGGWQEAGLGSSSLGALLQMAGFTSAEYQHWCAESLGIEFGCELSIQAPDGRERGVFSSSEIPQGTTILSIPFTRWAAAFTHRLNFSRTAPVASRCEDLGGSADHTLLPSSRPRPKTHKQTSAGMNERVLAWQGSLLTTASLSEEPLFQEAVGLRLREDDLLALALCYHRSLGQA
jgi:hypothetical protein